MTENNGIAADSFHTMGHPGVWTSTSATHSRLKGEKKRATARGHCACGTTRNAQDWISWCRFGVSAHFPSTNSQNFNNKMENISESPSSKILNFEHCETKWKKMWNFALQLAWLCDCNLIRGLMLECIASVPLLLLLVLQFGRDSIPFRLPGCVCVCVCGARLAFIHSVHCSVFAN